MLLDTFLEPYRCKLSSAAESVTGRTGTSMKEAARIGVCILTFGSLYARVYRFRVTMKIIFDWPSRTAVQFNGFHEGRIANPRPENGIIVQQLRLAAGEIRPGPRFNRRRVCSTINCRTARFRPTGN